MRRVLIALSLAASLSSGIVHAQSIAVADSLAAFWSTDAAKKALEDMNNGIKPQRDRLQTLTKEIEDLRKRATADQKVMSQADLQRLQNQAQAKINEYNSTAEGVQKRIEETEASVQRAMMPKMEKVVEDLRKEGNYSIIIEKKYAIWADPTVDLTKKIVDRMNAAK